MGGERPSAGAEGIRRRMGHLACPLSSKSRNELVGKIERATSAYPACSSCCVLTPSAGEKRLREGNGRDGWMYGAGAVDQRRDVLDDGG